MEEVPVFSRGLFVIFKRVYTSLLAAGLLI
jgi:hypothetical protein